MNGAPNAQELLRALRLLLETHEKELKRLTTREATLAEQVQTLERRAVLAEENQRALDVERRRLSGRERELEGTVSALRRQLEDAEQRAQMHESRGDALQPRADRHDKLEAACRRLLEQLDALPLDLKDAAMIPGAARPKIELYGTYDWQSVMDAKLGLMLVMRREE